MCNNGIFKWDVPRSQAGKRASIFDSDKIMNPLQQTLDLLNTVLEAHSERITERRERMKKGFRQSPSWEGAETFGNESWLLMPSVMYLSFAQAFSPSDFAMTERC